MKKPNFFVVGAPKCGTTALSQYLSEHSRIFVSRLKEPHFFAKEFLEFRPYYVQTEDDYLKLFEEATEEHLAVGEASVWYFYSATALEAIYEFDKTARIIVMLRNPVDMVYSLHSQFRFSLVEDVPEFVDAWRLQYVRKAGKNIPKAARTADSSAELLQYGQVGKLGAQMERLLTIFPDHQVRPILYDDFRAATREVYDDVLAFLNVPDDGRTSFEAVNQNKIKKAYWMASWSRRVKAVANTVGIKNTGLFGFIDDKNTQHSRREPLSPQFRQELTDYFSSDIKLLSKLLRRNLDHWLTTVTV